MRREYWNLLEEKFGTVFIPQTEIGINLSLHFVQVPYYLGDLTEKLEAEDRVQLVKAAEGQLLVLILARKWDQA